MEIKELKPRKALNKAFLKVKPNRTEIERFKTNLIQLLDRTNDTESEEFHKNLVIDFLKKTYYDPNHYINTKGRNDLVIHNGNNASSTVGVIVEAKKPTNKTEMMTTKKLNAKAFQELVLYYLRERIIHKNLEVKHLVATNINEWFIFDANVFDRLFAQNKNLVKQFTDFESGRLAETKTDFFYKQIAEPFIADILTPLPSGGAVGGLEFTYFDLRDYQKPLRNVDKADDNQLIALFKLLSPEHLLKLPFTNDSNSLDKRFYSELLHIIGLTETKEGGKKLIQRNKEGERNSGSMLEDAIIQLDSLDKINRLDKSNQFGNNQQERLFNVGLELSITWINRILFLKLLEAQLISYHKGDKSYSFLNYDKIKNYDDLNSLFFQVLARKYDDRNDDVKKAFEKVPYLNSSLFEPTEIEQITIFISNLKDDKTIPIISSSVLKNEQGKKRTGNLTTLAYLFDFLNAYDFTSEGSEDIQEENKSLINASVLGLIFEKINGYKDGSFFTPGFITMYMCRETIRKAVVQKFNETKNWNCLTVEDLYDKIEDRQEANDIVNSIKICDPAVGSGHFLVSALNEMIAVKNDLKILQDRKGRRLKEYHVEVVNDELIVTDEEGLLFEYTPGLSTSGGIKEGESQRIQETLFHEKQTIIENCLFGVDINPNSVKICRLRLWIELLKNAYYISSPPFKGGVPEGGGGSLLKSGVPEGGGGSLLKSGVPEGGGGSLSNPQPEYIPTPNPDPSHPINNLPYLNTFRKDLRNNLTPAEAKLWTLLKGKSLEGRKFRRQHSVANYILDFYCPEERIAIELDGQGHYEGNQAEYDRERDLFLNTFGIRVLRFENKWVWDNPDGLLAEVKKYFGKQPPRPADTPPLKGGERLELQTLPNIDINIKCGNSLVSRFAIDSDLSQALKKSKWTIDSYRLAVDTYRNAESKEQKREMEKLIALIKSDFRSEISLSDPKAKKLRKLAGELFQMTQQTQLFAMGKKEKANWNKKVSSLAEETKKLEVEIEEIKSNKIFENAFEWRFEFPEVLNDEGDFIGFDVVIGNPPYVDLKELDNSIVKFIFSNYPTSSNRVNLYSTFVEKAFSLLKKQGYFSFIIPNSILMSSSYQSLRNLIKKEIYGIVKLPEKVFEDASVETAIIELKKNAEFDSCQTISYKKNDEIGEIDVTLKFTVPKKSWEIYDEPKFNIYISDSILKPLNKIHGKGKRLEDIADFTLGITPYDKYKGHSKKLIENKEFHSSLKLSDEYKPLIKGENILPYFVGNKENGFIKYGSWLGAPREERFFTEPRVIVRQIVSGKPPKIYAGYTDQNLYFTQIGFSIIPKSDITVFELTALLNSKLINFYHKYLFLDIEKELFQKILIENCKLFPCKPFRDSNYVKKVVEKIVEIKTNNPNTDTTDLETDLDKIIYQLYDLTEDEIKIVEGNS